MNKVSWSSVVTLVCLGIVVIMMVVDFMHTPARFLRMEQAYKAGYVRGLQAGYRAGYEKAVEDALPSGSAVYWAPDGSTAR